MQKEKKASFEASLSFLKDLVNKMENSEIELEAALSAFEKGMHLVDECEKRLKEAEQRVEIYNTTSDTKNREKIS